MIIRRGNIHAFLLWLLAAAAACAIAVSGCGGDDDGGGGETSVGNAGTGSGAGTEAPAEDRSSEPKHSSPRPKTRAEFLTRANALCAEKKRELGAELRAYLADKVPFATKDDEESAAADFLADVWRPTMQAEIDGIEELGELSGNGKDVAPIVEEARDLVAKAEEDPAPFVRTSLPYRRLWHRTNAYGLNSCFQF